MIVRTTNTASGSLTGTELAAWRGMLRVYAAVFRDLDAELQAAHDLPLSSYEVLQALHEAPKCELRMAELADHVLLSRSGLTRLADRLEGEGLIERCPCPTDARGSFASLTDEGRRRFRAAQKTHLTGVRERFLAPFETHELGRLAQYWERLLPGAVTD